jgi:imidazolonepropionase-like amidohydrolase
MRTILRALIGLLLAGGLTAQTTPPLGITNKTPELQAFVNARIHTSPSEVLDSATLVIDRGKIVAVGRKVSIPNGAVTIDLEGKTIYPGFIEPYSDYGLKSPPEPPKRRRNEPPVYEATRIGCNAWNGAIHAEENWVDRFQPDPERAKELKQLGFTSAQSACLDGVFRGRGFVTSLGDGLPNDLVIRPRSWHFLSFDKGSSVQEYPTSEMGAIALIRQTLLDADWYRRAHAAHRLNPQQEMPETNTALEALQGVTGETMVFDLPDLHAIFRADRLARECGINAVALASGYDYERSDELKSIGRTLIVPVDFPEPPDIDKPHSELDLSLTDLRRWDWAPSNPAILEQKGIKFAFTTHQLKEPDEFIDQIRKAIGRGLSEKTALAALTTVPAEICGVGDLIGTLQPGKLADFVVCDGNIFAEKTNVCAVYAHGKRTEFIALDEARFDGLFTGELFGRKIELKLEDGRRDGRRRISGTLSCDTVEVDLDHEGCDHNQLSFTVDLDDLGGRGIARFVLRKENNNLVGKATYADGRTEDWVVTRPKERVEGALDEPESDRPHRDGGNKNNVADTTVSRITYPNMAFGCDTLPVPQTVLVRNATIWTCDSAGVLANADMLVNNGRIEALGRNLTAPAGCTIIDASGKCVAPGVIDEHSHMCVAGDINEGSDAISSEVRIADVIDPDDINIYRSLAGGVTAARILHGSANPIGGQADMIKLRWGADAEGLKLAGVPPSIKFALGENVKQSGWGDQFSTRYPQSRMGVETIIRDAFQTALEYEFDLAAYETLSAKQRERTVPPRRNLRLDALVEVLHSRMSIACHAYVQSEMLMMMRLAEQYGIRLGTFVHVLEGYKVADEMARHGVGGASAPDWWAYKFEVYDAIAQNPGLMHEKGVVTSINSDSPHLQRLLNQAAAKSVMYTGMSEEDALKMVTLNPARQVGLDRRIGSLKVGKDADFAIWSGNPLSVYSKVEQTWIDGRKYFDLVEDLRRRVELADERNRLIQKILSQPERKWNGGGDEADGDRKYPMDGGTGL